MRSARRISLLLDAELAALVEHVAAREAVSVSAVVRDALRAHLQLADPFGRGWREGYAAARAEVARRVETALREAACPRNVHSTKGPFGR